MAIGRTYRMSPRIEASNDADHPGWVRFVVPPGWGASATDESKSDGPYELRAKLPTSDSGSPKIEFEWDSDRPTEQAKQWAVEMWAENRIRDRVRWIGQVTGLIQQVKQWADAHGWATRIIDKQLDDRDVGDHQVPVLLLQQKLCRLILEPMARETAGGAQGLVQLCVMPVYDDVAILPLIDGQWQISYVHEAENGMVDSEDEQLEPLNETTILSVLDRMLAHAG